MVEMPGVEPGSRTMIDTITTLISGARSFVKRSCTGKGRITSSNEYPPAPSGENSRGLLARTEAQALLMPSSGFRVSASATGRWLIN